MTSGPSAATVPAENAIVQVANQYGIPPALALAIAQHESGFNTHAVGDQGTSFGLYQLHQGGELNSLPGTLQQQISAAYDPVQNARVALSRVAAVYKKNPNADLGMIAAQAQRPANPQAYAASIDSILSGYKKSPSIIQSIGNDIQNLPGVSTIVSADKTVASTASTAASVAGSTAKLASEIFKPSFWLRVGFIVIGTALVLIGVSKFVGGGSNSGGTTVIEETEDGGNQEESRSSSRQRNSKPLIGPSGGKGSAKKSGVAGTAEEAGEVAAA